MTGLLADKDTLLSNVNIVVAVDKNNPFPVLRGIGMLVVLIHFVRKQAVLELTLSDWTLQALHKSTHSGLTFMQEIEIRPADTRA